MKNRRPKWVRVVVVEGARKWRDYHLGATTKLRVREQVELQPDGMYLHVWELERESDDHRPRWRWLASFVLLVDAQHAARRLHDNAAAILETAAVLS